MTEELKAEARAFLKKMAGAKIHCLFLAFDKDTFHNMRNCDLTAAAKLMVNQIESSEEQQKVFVNELEALSQEVADQVTEN
ncbi:hypothetical protein [Chryseobacterium sp. MFBS3-17]|uniref:hypothetical protein n=1 Tax=Chryseobacterium sp. MFBS3-17 TaxID=2886689 RepID=UPI001D0DC3D4|nr:hypothetical protein [Chryseobacterium sp. MFBS3-17]MCC2590328.1 hypothetical protein [Chryseobacterium sp. MFBS3-17]